jgi:predicted RNase H-like HicB family nuclease
MRYALALEAMEGDHHIAWVLDLPGCFSSARTQAEAVAGAPGAIRAHLEWLRSCGRPARSVHSPGMALDGEPIQTQVVEVFQSFLSPENPDYIVNAFFEDDPAPSAQRRSISPCGSSITAAAS